MGRLAWLPMCVLCACGGAAGTATRPRPALTVVIAPGTPERTRVRSSIENAMRSSFDLRFAEVPSAPRAPAQAAAVELDVAAARKAYIAADFTPCIARLGDDTRLADELSEGRRLLAERILFWRIACKVGGGRAFDARADADAFAAYELEVPSDVASAAPEVEALLAAANQRAADGKRAPLTVTAAADAGETLRAPLRGVVGLDGRRAVCTTPCTLDVHPGDHIVRVEADGFSPETRRVRVEPAGGAVGVRLAAATAELAAAQWTARYADSASIDSAASVGLLSVATRASRLAIVSTEATPKGARLLGVLAQDGGVAARSERSAAAEKDLAEEAPGLVRDLLIRGQLLPSEPPLYKRPLFWGAVGVAAAAAAVVTIFIVREPEKKVGVTF